MDTLIRPIERAIDEAQRAADDAAWQGDMARAKMLDQHADDLIDRRNSGQQWEVAF